MENFPSAVLGEWSCVSVCVVYLQNQAGTGLGELAGAARRAGSHGSSSWGSTHGLEAEQRQWSDTEILQHSTGEMVTW